MLRFCVTQSVVLDNIAEYISCCIYSSIITIKIITLCLGRDREFPNMLNTR